MLNQPQVGDILMVKNTGAYNYSMASCYNRYPIPAVVLLSGDRSAIMVERESYEELLSHDRVPDWLK
jgi:diaminopimelate decarboxylase